MKFVGLSENVLIEVTVAELHLVKNSINEALEAVDDWEFGTRLGASKPDARRLLAEARRALDEAALAADSGH